MTEQEKEIIEMIRNCPDREYALLKAIEIFTLFAEQPSASQQPFAFYHQVLT